MNKFFTNIISGIKSFFKFLLKQEMTVFTTLLSSLFASLAICVYDVEPEETFRKLSISFLLAAITSLSAGYLTKESKPLKKYLIRIITAAVSVFTGAAILFSEMPSDYKTMAYMGIILAVVTVTVFIFYPKTESKAYVANVFKYFLFSGLISVVLFSGISLLILAFTSLIHEIDDPFNIYACFAAFIFIVFFINIFSYYLFQKTNEPSGKAFKVITLYILLPVYALLLVLLYSYLIKALILFKLPNGQINWFVSFATVFYLIFYFILREYEDLKVIKFFYKFGGLILIPLICVQIPAYFIRVNAYGLTGWRYTSLIYTIFAIISIASTFIKQGRYTKFAFPLLGIFILLVTVTPVNLISVSYKSQYRKMCKILEKYDLLKDGQPVTDTVKENPPQLVYDDYKELKESLRYLRASDYPAKGLLTENWQNSILDLFNIKEPDKIINDEGNFTRNYRSNFDYKTPFNISGYNYILQAHYRHYQSTDKIKITINDTKYDITKQILELSKYISKDDAKIQLTDDITILITYLSYEYDSLTKNFEIVTIDYFILSKQEFTAVTENK